VVSHGSSPKTIDWKGKKKTNMTKNNPIWASLRGVSLTAGGWGVWGWTCQKICETRVAGDKKRAGSPQTRSQNRIWCGVVQAKKNRGGGG